MSARDFYALLAIVALATVRGVVLTAWLRRACR